MDYTWVGGRRFFLACCALAAGTILQWCGKMDPSGAQYSVIVLGTVAAYITGNVVESNKK